MKLTAIGVRLQVIVSIALNLKEIEYEYIPVHLVKEGGQQHSEDYKLLNPGELVPALVDSDNESDIILNQSLAIIEYLDELKPEINRLIPEHKLDRAGFEPSLMTSLVPQPIQNLRDYSIWNNTFLPVRKTKLHG